MPPETPLDTPLEIVVVGAGIGGLSAAVALHRAGHRVRVLDRVRDLRPIGAGISLWSNGVKVLDALGLGDEIAAVGGRMERMAYRDRSGAVLCDFSLDPLVERVGERPYPVRRSDLQALLLAGAGPVVTTGCRCTAVEDDGDRVAVLLEDGSRLEADLVVAADGTHSMLRQHVVGTPTERLYLGYHNWNGLVPDAAALGEPSTWTTSVGEGKRVSSMPVRDGQYVFFDVPLADPAVTDRPAPEVLAEHFAGWGPDVHRLIDALDPAGIANVAIATHEPLDRFVRGRVVLLGDAAHTSAPDLGQGGCMAMEDALVLATHLADPDLELGDALARYEAERAPRAADVLRRARKRSGVTHGDDPAATDAWYAELAAEDGVHVIDGICRTIEAGPLG